MLTRPVWTLSGQRSSESKAASREGTTGSYDLDYASQGEEAYQKVKQAVQDKNPYQVAFVDMRMPPGWDGLETIEHVWKADPELQIVICTAYSDHSREEIIERLGASDRLLILKKPFDTV